MLGLKGVAVPRLDSSGVFDIQCLVPEGIWGATTAYNQTGYNLLALKRLLC